MTFFDLFKLANFESLEQITQLTKDKTQQTNAGYMNQKCGILMYNLRFPEFQMNQRHHVKINRSEIVVLSNPRTKFQIKNEVNLK